MADTTKNEDKMNAPDGGWGWLVAIGCCIILFLMPLMTICFSILFSGFLLEQQATSTATAWIFNTHTLLWNLVGPFVGPLTREFGYRSVVLVGSVMAAAGMLVCAFSTSIAFLLVFFSLTGMFGGLASKPCYLIIAVYFDKRRGLANAIIMGGMCAGQFAGPPVIRFLQRQVGFIGATMIVSSLLLNCCVGASFFHPVEWHMKKTVVPKETDSNSTSEINDDRETKAKRILSRMDDTEDKNLLTYKDSSVPSRIILRSRLRKGSECSNVSSVAMSMVDLSGISAQIEEKRVSTTSLDLVSDKSKNRSLPVRVIYALISDLGILRYHRAQIIAIGGLFFINGYLNFIMIVPFAVQAAGYTPEDAAWCISITGICNFIARLSSSFLSDYSWFNMRIMYMTGAVIVAVSTIVFSFLTDLTLMKVTLCFWAYGIGVNISLYVLVMARIMGVENMAAIFGAESLLVGIGYVVLGPLIGFIRDVTDSYAVSMWVMSAEEWLCVILWFFMPAAIIQDQKKDREAKEEEEEEEEEGTTFSYN